MKRVLSKMMAAAFIATVVTNAYPLNVHARENTLVQKAGKAEEQKWNLVWQDNFDGDSLNLKDWNYETHEPGWVNNELQEYTNSTKNIYVKDGNLVIKANKEETPKGTKYTSGKVTTQNKHDFKYGKMEARIKVPKGQGLWPAFWMMPRDENLYGSWPRCGEIDIMETLGHQPEKAYGTIHYGNPHQESQGTYTLKGDSFADSYHTFAVEWEPSEMRFYIDGNLYHTVNDWYTKQDGGEEITYPAPFDQNFYLQFNLAVGGNWPGNPDSTTNFDNAEYKIDYVKVYQKDSYDENVKRPEKKPVVLREPDASGNYINNGNFSVNEDLTDNANWQYLNALGGVGTAEIKDNKIVLKSENEGTVDYSLQLLQGNVPLKKNGIYRVSFDAKSTEPRSMIVDMSSPDRGYSRQFADTTVELTDQLKKYSYEFTMNDSDDPNTRLEFNFGHKGSLADIELSNVRVEKIGEETEKEPKKTILPDGNYVYNGTFDVGQDRMKYWDVQSKLSDANVSVTNTNNIRELKTVVPQSVSDLSDVIVKESELGLSKGKEYFLSFDAYADENKTIKAQIGGQAFDADLTTAKKNFKYKITAGDTKDLEFLLGAAGTTYIDNVRIEDTSLITNGDFCNDFSKWQVFADSSIASDVSSEIDKTDGENAAKVNIKNTGDADWKIQLKQTGVKLEKGKKYKLSLDAKSTIDRAIMFTIQRDGSSDDNWIPYAPTQTVDVGNEYKNYNVTFDMKEDTDPASIFTISMGAVNGKQITDEHSVSVKNVKLEEVNDVNKDDLADVIGKAKDIINGDNINNIVEEDVAKLKASLEEAEKVFNNSLATQEEIDKAVVNLKNIISSLRNKVSDQNRGNDSGNKTTPSNNSGENNVQNASSKSSDAVGTSDEIRGEAMLGMLLAAGGVAALSLNRKRKKTIK